MKHGLYYTVYGNACEYTGGYTAYDIDMAESIPMELIDFEKFIREV